MSLYALIQGIDGNVTGKGLEKHIQLESCNFSIKRKMNTQPGSVTNREGTKPSVSEVVLTKRADETSPSLFKEAAIGQAIPSVELKFVNTGSDLAVYQQITLSDAIVSGYEFAYQAAVVPKADDTSSVELKPMETITLNFRKIEVKYVPYDKSNKAGSPRSTGYDLETAQAM